MDLHPITHLFPAMTPDEFAALKADIAEHGQREPIWTSRGQIVDGRNRWRACEELGLAPKTREWNGEGSLAAFVVSLNLQRRHLTSSQKAAVALDLLPWLEREAKGRQGARADLRDIPQIFAEGDGAEAREQAAKLAGTNRQYVSDAKKLQNEAPTLLEAVRVGTLTLPEAKKAAQLPEPVREHVITTRQADPDKKFLEAVREGRRALHDAESHEAPWPSGKYRVLYADPPWHYGNSGLDDYGHAERHYPTMSTDALCTLPVAELAEDNAVLFLWATSPLLEDALRIIRVWGFHYKTSFVWDKVKPNFGYYNSVRHEFLLIATRGSCLPDRKELLDSVVEEPRSDRHSEKPARFREIIDHLYPQGHRIELFARTTAPGWDAWGNQA